MIHLKDTCACLQKSSNYMEQRAKLLFEIFDSVFVGIFWGSTQNFASDIE